MSWKDFYSLTKEEQNEYTLLFGGFNDFPPGWHQLTEEEFAKSSFFSYAPDIVQHRQMFKKDSNVPAVSANLFFMHDKTGFAIVHDFWAGKVTFYKFELCKHEWGPLKDPSQRQNYLMPNVKQCIHCDYVWSYDSSD